MRSGEKVVDLQRILDDPAAFFEDPEDVLKRNDLDRQSKIAILRSWKRHDKDFSRRTGKRLDGEPPRLARIIRALNALLHDQNMENGTGDGRAGTDGDPGH